MPTFVFFRHSKELDRVRGADAKAIEATLVKHYKEKLAFGGEGHSMLQTSATAAAAATKSATSTDESNRSRLEQAAQERFGNANEGQTMTVLRLRLPDLATPVNIRLSTDRTLDDVRQLLVETISSLKTTPFEFMEPPALKIKREDEKKTIAEGKLTNAVLTVKRM